MVINKVIKLGSGGGPVGRVVPSDTTESGSNPDIGKVLSTNCKICKVNSRDENNENRDRTEIGFRDRNNFFSVSEEVTK